VGCQNGCCCPEEDPVGGEDGCTWTPSGLMAMKLGMELANGSEETLSLLGGCLRLLVGRHCDVYVMVDGGE
jgi:hypothetical protein